MQISEGVYGAMPPDVQAMFEKQPNHGSDEVLAGFPVTASGNLNAGHKRGSGVTSYDGGGGVVWRDYGGDSGSAARFFYCAKASKAERNRGCENLKPRKLDDSRKEGNPGGDNPRNRGVKARTNSHPTVKPLALMRYLCRLVTPPSGTVLDPFAGSGSTLIAALEEGFVPVGIEMDAGYCEIARARLATVQPQPQLPMC